MEELNKMGKKDVYQAYLRLQRDTEMLTWNRLYIFLVFNSILVVSWATLWPSHGREVPSAVYYTLGALGILSGLVWAALGYRGRIFLEKYGDRASEIEKDLSFWTADLINNDGKTPVYMPMTESIALTKTLPWRMAGSKSILTLGPIAVAAFHGLMLAIVMGWCFR